MKKKTKIIIGISVVALIVIVCFFLLKGKHKKAELTYQTAIIERGSITNTITATGTIEPISTVEVGTQVSGTIAKLYVDYNTQVKKGQLLAELDRTLLVSELNAQRTNLESAKNELDFQQKNFNRTKQLYEKHAISETEYEEAEYKYNSAKYAYQRAQSQVVSAQTNLNYATIYSPINGVILSRAVDEGQTVAASFNTPTLFTIAEDLTKMQVIADIDEADIGQVKEGQKVTFTVDAYPDDQFEGKVTQVRLEAQTNSNVVTYNVVIEAPNPDLKLMPGLTANITVYTMDIPDVLLLPAKATTYMPTEQMIKNAPKPNHKPEREGKPMQPENMPLPTDMPSAPNDSLGNAHNYKMVWVKENNDIHPVRVEVGQSNRTYYEILNGLKEGDEIIVGETNENTFVEQENEAHNNPFMPGPPGKKNGNKKR